MAIKRFSQKEKRKIRVRIKIKGSAKTPRISVNRTNKHIYAQIIDDVNGKTLLAIKTTHAKGTKTERAFNLGKMLAEGALKKKISKAVFDRGSFRFHGRVKALADGAREGGLKI